jgi:hypothetical protein
MRKVIKTIVKKQVDVDAQAPTGYRDHSVLRFGVVGALLGVVGLANATDPTPLFDWSTNITAMRGDVVATVGGNIAAIFGVFALFVVMALVWKFLRKAGARTR